MDPTQNQDPSQNQTDEFAVPTPPVSESTSFATAAPQQPVTPELSQPVEVTPAAAVVAPVMPDYATAPVTPVYTAPAGTATVEENPNKNYLLTVAFSYFLGSLGVDRFYLGKTGTAILKLLTGGGLGIWSMIDLILVAVGKLRQKTDSRPLEGYTKFNHPIRIVAIVLAIITTVTIVGVFLIMMFTAASGIQQKADTLTTSSNYSSSYSN